MTFPDRPILQKTAYNHQSSRDRQYPRLVLVQDSVQFLAGRQEKRRSRGRTRQRHQAQSYDRQAAAERVQADHRGVGDVRLVARLGDVML